MTDRADQLYHNKSPAHSTALVEALLAKHHITEFCQHPYSPDLAPCDIWLFPRLKSPLKERIFVTVLSVPLIHKYRLYCTDISSYICYQLCTTVLIVHTAICR